MRLPRHYYEGEWSTSGTAMSVEFGGEPTSRSAKRLGLLSPFYADPTMARIGDEGLGHPPHSISAGSGGKRYSTCRTRLADAATAHRAFEELAIVIRGSTTTPTLSLQQRLGQCHLSSDQSIRSPKLNFKSQP